LQIAHLYKHRWKIELFFKWIKQHLKIKSFYGTSPNTVYSQIWIAISSYLLVVIIKKRLKLTQNPYTLLQIFSLSLFEKIPVNELLTGNNTSRNEKPVYNQLKFF
jgi:IS4 transposase